MLLLLKKGLKIKPLKRTRHHGRIFCYAIIKGDYLRIMTFKFAEMKYKIIFSHSRVKVKQLYPYMTSRRLKGLGSYDI